MSPENKGRLGVVKALMGLLFVGMLGNVLVEESVDQSSEKKERKERLLWRKGGLIASSRAILGLMITF